MARRKKPLVDVSVHETLDRVGAGERLAAGELEAAAAAAAGLRRDWLREISEAMAFLRANTPEFLAFKNCLQSVGTLFVQHGILSASEMQTVWVSIEDIERR